MPTALQAKRMYYKAITTSTKQGLYRYCYTGQEKDGKLYNYRARVYDFKLRRFLSPDKVNIHYSSYAYVGDNPIKYTDPTGNCEICELAKKEKSQYKTICLDQIDGGIVPMFNDKTIVDFVNKKRRVIGGGNNNGGFDYNINGTNYLGKVYKVEAATEEFLYNEVFRFNLTYRLIDPQIKPAFLVTKEALEGTNMNVVLFPNLGKQNLELTEMEKASVSEMMRDITRTYGFYHSDPNTGNFVFSETKTYMIDPSSFIFWFDPFFSVEHPRLAENGYQYYGYDTWPTMPQFGGGYGSSVISWPQDLKSFFDLSKQNIHTQQLPQKQLQQSNFKTSHDSQEVSASYIPSDEELEEDGEIFGLENKLKFQFIKELNKKQLINDGEAGLQERQ